MTTPSSSHETHSSTAETYTNQVVQSVKENPGPALLVGAGLAWFALSQQNIKTQRFQDKIESKLNTMKEHSSEKVESLTEYASDVVDQAKDRLSSDAESAKRALATKNHEVKSSFETLKEDNPLALGGLALVCGIAVGLALPITRRENEMMGDAKEQLITKAKTAAANTREAAKEALESRKDEMVDAVAQAKETVKDAMTEAVDDVKETAKSQV